MGLFKKKTTIDDAAKAIHEYTQSQGEKENIIFLRAQRTEKGFIMKEGSINAAVEMLPRMLMECAKNDEHFAKALVTVSESIKFNEPEMMAFSNNLTGKTNKIDKEDIGKITDALKDKFPGAEVVSLDVSKIDEMDPEDFQKIVDRIYKAAQNNDNGDSK